MTDERLLEVGDIIYCKQHAVVKWKLKVFRVSKRYAFCKSYPEDVKLEREVNETGRIAPYHVALRGIIYQIESDELNQEWERNRLLSEVQSLLKVNPKKLSLSDLSRLRDTLREIYSINR